MRFQTLYEGRLIFFILFVLLLLSGYWHSGILGFLSLAGILFCLNFFRDPDRGVPPDADAVVAAADGVVDDIIEIDEPEVLKGKARRISIFLNVFDVHVNRAPIAGKVTHRVHYPGNWPGPYLDARHPECATYNEALTWAFAGAKATIVVRQITGAIARRIVPWSRVGDEVEKGFRFGMIRFGSRTEIYLPLNAEVVVKLGDRVRGAESIIARLK
jgi:phosphatidylserine decarboxylase